MGSIIRYLQSNIPLVIRSLSGTNIPQTIKTFIAKNMVNFVLNGMTRHSGLVWNILDTNVRSVFIK